MSEIENGKIEEMRLLEKFEGENLDLAEKTGALGQQVSDLTEANLQLKSEVAALKSKNGDNLDLSERYKNEALDSFNEISRMKKSRVTFEVNHHKLQEENQYQNTHVAKLEGQIRDLASEINSKHGELAKNKVQTAKLQDDFNSLAKRYDTDKSANESHILQLENVLVSQQSDLTNPTTDEAYYIDL
jgi:peptidoglycan hydrolase CwlO-like protein